MSDSSASFVPAKPGQRVLATCLNAVIIVVLAFVAEYIAVDSGAVGGSARAAIAGKSLFGMCAIFWLFCGQARTSPGLALMKLRVVQADAPKKRISLITALIRPLPYFLIGAALTFPVSLIPRSMAPVQFIVVLGGALFLSANTTTLWSGDDRRTMMDRWLKTRVIRK